MDNYNNNGYDNGYNNNDNRNNNRNNNNNNKKPKNVNLIIFIIIAAVVTFIGLTLLSNMFRNATYKEISYDQFMQMIDEDKVKKVALEHAEDETVAPQGTHVTGTQSRSFIHILYRIC